MKVRLRLVLGWCLFLPKFQAGGAYSGGAYNKACIRLIRSSKIRHNFTKEAPTQGHLSEIVGFLKILEHAPGIARRADRVGVLPLAPLASTNS